MTIPAILAGRAASAGQSFLLGTVTAVAAGTPPMVSVQVDGADTAISAYPANKVLALNERVILSRIGSQVYVIASLATPVSTTTTAVLTPLNGWTFYGAPYGAPIAILSSGFVVVRGLIKSGTKTALTPVVNLPVGMRPAVQKVFTTYSTDGPIRVDVQTNGDVIITLGMTGNTYLSLDGISFIAGA